VTKQFILAGDATFTIDTPADGHRTFRVRYNEASERWPECWFVSMLTGSDNESDYSYLGKLDRFTGQLVLTAKSKLPADSHAVRLLNRVLARVWTGDHAAYEHHGFITHHEGRCGRCGRKLTVPSSIESGIGPECAKQMAGELLEPPAEEDFTLAIQKRERDEEEARCRYKMERDEARKQEVAKMVRDPNCSDEAILTAIRR